MNPLKTRQQARDEFRRTGTSIGAWARAHGFSVPNTYQVLIGRNTGERGEAHRIAVTLGIKDGIVQPSLLTTPKKHHETTLGRPLP